MLSEIQEIKNIRKKLGLTQFQLAKMASVSQSLIAKIEASKLDPTYSNALKIFDALNNFGRKKEIKAEQIMSHKIISVLPNDTINSAILKMKKYGISQLPVIDDHKSIGMVTESSILNSMLQKKGNYVEDIMESPPPVISSDASPQLISSLLKYFPMILVSKKGNLIGVITKADLLEKLYTS